MGSGSEQDKEHKKEYEKLCKEIQKAWLALLIYALFFILVLLQPDEMTLKPAETIEMPFIEVSVGIPFSKFAFVGPVVLCVILFGMHLLLERWHADRFDLYRYEHGPAYLFNLKSKLARATSIVVFYALGPFLLAGLLWKLRAWPDLWQGYLFAGVVSSLLLLVFDRRHRSPGTRGWTLICGATVALLALISWPPQLAARFPLQLANSELDEQDLRSYYLRNAVFTGASLKGADLRGMRLGEADFSFSHLEGADFSHPMGANRTRLRGAHFSFAHLEGADFTDAYLKQAHFDHGHLSGADFEKAILDGADFRRAHLEEVDFTGATLAGEKTFVRAYLSKADLTCQHFKSFDFTLVDLDGAELSGADLTDAKFTRTKLSNADLTGARLDGAKFLRAKLANSDIERATFTAATFERSDLSGLKSVDHQFMYACADKYTVPADLVHPCPPDQPLPPVSGPECTAAGPNR
jgi:uncharacterized protein YjbI with pentapeptide repeats